MLAALTIVAGVVAAAAFAAPAARGAHLGPIEVFQEVVDADDVVQVGKSMLFVDAVLDEPALDAQAKCLATAHDGDDEEIDADDEQTLIKGFHLCNYEQLMAINRYKAETGQPPLHGKYLLATGAFNVGQKNVFAHTFVEYTLGNAGPVRHEYLDDGASLFNVGDNRRVALPAHNWLAYCCAGGVPAPFFIEDTHEEFEVGDTGINQL